MPTADVDEKIHGTLDKKLQADYWDLAKEQKLHERSHAQCDQTCEKMVTFAERIRKLDERAAQKPPVEPAPEDQLQAIKNKARSKQAKVNSALSKIGMGEKYSKGQISAQKKARVVQTIGGKQALELKRDGDQVIFIAAPEPKKALTLDHMNVDSFDTMYKPMDGNPVEKIAKLFAGWMLDLGATPQAVEELSVLINVPDKEKEIAMAKNSAAAVLKNGKSNGKTTKSTKGKATGKLRVAREGERESAAALFRKLIMAGGKTDDAIFKEVQKKFNLDDKKRSYVAWYRNDLRKHGQKPPEPK